MIILNSLMKSICLQTALTAGEASRSRRSAVSVVSLMGKGVCDWALLFVTDVERKKDIESTIPVNLLVGNPRWQEGQPHTLEVSERTPQGVEEQSRPLWFLAATTTLEKPRRRRALAGLSANVS